MSAPKWTPAPYEVCPGDDGDLEIVALEPSDPLKSQHVLATVYFTASAVGGPNITDAKTLANLFAAAPELYEALDKAMVVRLGESLEEFKERYSRWHREYRVPALAKARGEATPS